MRSALSLALVASVLWVVGACSSSTGPHVANISGSWFDSTSYANEVDMLSITQHGDSVQITSPGYYVGFAYNGVAWWGHEGQAANATGAIFKDSIALCDAAIGPPCPNEIAYLRDSNLVIYLGPIAGTAWDSTDLGFTFVHQTWTPGNTTAPSNAPPPVQIASVWASDSMAWNGTCPGVVQNGLGVGNPINANFAATILQIADAISYGQSWTRQCGSPTWNAQSGYIVFVDPAPCTPADGCLILAEDTSLATDTTDSWFLRVASEDSLADATPTYLNTGWLPQYFLLDSGVTSLARVKSSPRQSNSSLAARMAGLLAQQRAVRRFRAARVRPRRPSWAA